MSSERESAALGPPFAAGGKPAPYWWDRVPRPAPADVEIPPNVDVAIVGSGYTGLHAALQTARGARRTIVFDEGDLGFGCSTRNGGQISTSVKPGYEMLARRYGASGCGMGSYLGMRVGQQVLEREEGRTAFDRLPFETRPIYRGRPWFLAPSIRYYRWRDRLPI